MNSQAKVIRNAVIVGGSCVLLAIVIFLINPSPMWIKLVSDGFPLLLSFSGAVIAFSVYRRQAKTRGGIRIWGTMTLGLVFWTFGEAIWTFYELVLRQEVPYPSVADVMWAVGYIPLVLSVGYQFLSLRAPISRKGKLLIAAIVLAMIVLAVWLVVYPILASPDAGTPFEMFFSLAYPLEDLILFSIGTALVLTFLGGQLALSWGAIALGILLLSFSDLLFSYGTWNGLYYPEGRLNFLSAAFDTLYISAYVVWNIGLFLRLKLPESGKDIDVHLFVPKADSTAAGEKKDYLLMTDAERRVIFMDPALVPILGLKNPGEGVGRPFGPLLGLGHLEEEAAVQKAEQTGASDGYPVSLGSSGEKYRLRVIASEDRREFPGWDILLQPESQADPASRDQEAFLLGRIVHRAKEQERGQRASGEEDFLRVYFNALIGLLHVLVTRAGGAGVGAAFEAEINEKARRLGCALELRDGHILWGEAATEPAKYQTLLEDGIRYAKSIVATSTIDRKLQEIEKYMAPKVVQAAEENRLRMVRWLDEKPR
jgi:PAS domain-containing protein